MTTAYNDPSAPILNLIRVIRVLCAHLSAFSNVDVCWSLWFIGLACEWCFVFQRFSCSSSMLLATEFVNSKLTAKAARQLQG